MLSPENPVLCEIETPALVIDKAALVGNIQRMASIASGAGVALRPHAKTHKSPAIARLQIEAGAIGVSCATILEAEAMAAAGIGGLLITAPMMGEGKFARAARLNRQQRLSVVVDHVAQVEGLAGAVAAGEPRLQILIDVDVGQRRTGVTGAGAALDLAAAIGAAAGLELAGVQGYAGHVQHILEPEARRRAAMASAQALGEVVAALGEAGHRPRIVSGSGTGTFGEDITGPFNELQVGSYVLMDADYARVVDERGAGPQFAPSLWVLATVVSVNRPGEVTVDAGTKALATNGPSPCHILGVPAGSSYAFAGDEHGVITVPTGRTTPGLGARVLIGATHCDPTVNLHPYFHVVSGGDAASWPISGRYQ